MKWKSILKDEQSYGEMLNLIERLEKLLDNLYDDIEEQAIKMNKETGFPLEQARELIKNIQKDIINETEKELDRMRKELPRHIRE
jgi:F0F1-type ATP synthase membrane subunit b/b'|tara:strand:+ start:279 stop:533 length:255 start_codon:yes stop_codon:yes gene_type:complete